MIELLFQKLDPQNVERNCAITFFKLSSARSTCSAVSLNRSYPLTLSLFLCFCRSLHLFLILSVSPCIFLSVMSALCVQRSGRVADYFLIYLQAAEHNEQLKPAQYSCVCMRVCMRALSLFERKACASEKRVCTFACVCVHTCVSRSCWGCAALWQCHRRGVLVCEPVRPQPPSLPASQHGRFSEASSPLMYSFFSLLYIVWVSNSCSTLGIAGPGQTAL